MALTQIIPSLLSPPAKPPTPQPPPPPPRSPAAWKWRCHLCKTVYSLSCTTRCLECSHRCCIGYPALRLPAGIKPMRPKGGHSRPGGGHKALCEAGFDYPGWEAWGDWRREGRKATRAAAAAGTEGRTEAVTYDEEWQGAARRRAYMKRVRSFVRGTHDCSRDCNHPSECIRERRRARSMPIYSDSSSDSKSGDHSSSSSRSRSRSSSSDGRRAATAVSKGCHRGIDDVLQSPLSPPSDGED